MATNRPTTHTPANVIARGRMPSGVRVFCDNVNCGMAQAGKSFIHITPQTQSPPQCRCCGQSFPHPDFRLYERKSEGPWPLKATSSKAVGKGSGGKGSYSPPPLIRPAVNTAWADMQSSRGASRASTPSRRQVDTSNGPARQQKRTQASYADTTPSQEAADSSLGAVTALLKQCADLLAKTQSAQSSPTQGIHTATSPEFASLDQTINKLSKQHQSAVSRAKHFQTVFRTQVQAATETYKTWQQAEQDANELALKKQEALAEQTKLADQSKRESASAAQTQPQATGVQRLGAALDNLPPTSKAKFEGQFQRILADFELQVQEESRGVDQLLREGTDNHADDSADMEVDRSAQNKRQRSTTRSPRSESPHRSRSAASSAGRATRRKSRSRSPRDGLDDDPAVLLAKLQSLAEPTGDEGLAKQAASKASGSTDPQPGKEARATAPASSPNLPAATPETTSPPQPRKDQQSGYHQIPPSPSHGFNSTASGARASEAALQAQGL